MNLAGAVLLGTKGSQKSRHRFAAFLENNHVQRFNHFVDDVLHTRKKLRCESMLIANSQRPATSIRIEAVPDDDGRECRMVVIDTTVSAANAKHLSRRITDNISATEH